MSNEVGLRLKELRRKLNMTQPQLGEKLGIKATTLAKMQGTWNSGQVFYF
jgi:DNA-binding XRE family transcriptional regulator